MSASYSYEKYKISIESITDFCVSANSDAKIESTDYVLHGNCAYIIKDSGLLKMIEDGKVSYEDINDIGEFLEANPEYLEKYFGNFKIELTEDYSNEITITKFWRYLQQESNELKEIYAIPGSTIKGILKTGFFSMLLENCEIHYNYNRNKSEKDKLNLYGIGLEHGNTKSKILKNNQQVYKFLTEEIEYIKNNITLFKANKKSKNFWNEVEEKEYKNLLRNSENIIFKNLICSDAKFSEGNFSFKKLDRIDRRHESERKSNSNKMSFQYAELASKRSKFVGEIKEARNKGDAPISLLTFSYAKKYSLIDLCIDGLKIYSEKLIAAEKMYFEKKISSLNSANKYFYDELERLCQDDYIVIKLGISGIHAKSFMSFDKQNLQKPDFMPYTLNIVDDTKLPVGWVKIKIEKEELKEDVESK